MEDHLNIDKIQSVQDIIERDAIVNETTDPPLRKLNLYEFLEDDNKERITKVTFCDEVTIIPIEAKRRTPSERFQEMVLGLMSEKEDIDHREAAKNEKKSRKDRFKDIVMKMVRPEMNSDGEEKNSEWKRAFDKAR